MAQWTEQASIIYRNCTKCFGQINARFFTTEAIENAIRHIPPITDLLRMHHSEEDTVKNVIELGLLPTQQLKQLRQHTVKQELVVKTGKPPRSYQDLHVVVISSLV